MTSWKSSRRGRYTPATARRSLRRPGDRPRARRRRPRPADRESPRNGPGPPGAPSPDRDRRREQLKALATRLPPCAASECASIRDSQIVLLRLQMHRHPAVAIGGDPFVRDKHELSGMLLGPAVMHQHPASTENRSPPPPAPAASLRPRLAERHLVEAEERTGIGELVLGQSRRMTSRIRRTAARASRTAYGIECSKHGAHAASAWNSPSTASGTGPLPTPVTRGPSESAKSSPLLGEIDRIAPVRRQDASAGARFSSVPQPRPGP